MTFFKRAAMMLTVASLGVSLLGTSALAIEVEQGNIKESIPFTDVKITDYFFIPIMKMSEAGILSGYGDGTFGPNDFISHVQALKIICNIGQVSYPASTVPGDWSSGLVSWAKANKIIGDIDLNAKATREDIADYIVKIFQFNSVSYTDEIEETDYSNFTDTKSRNVNLLYYLGIVKGVENFDGTLRYNPNDKISRAEACMILSRLSNQKAPTWAVSLQQSEKPSSSSAFPLDYSYYDKVKLPETVNNIQAYQDVWEYMLIHKIPSYTFDVNSEGMTMDEIGPLRREMFSVVDATYANYIDYASFYDTHEITITYEPQQDNTVKNATATFVLKDKICTDTEELIRQTVVFEKACDKILVDLYKSGRLSNTMTDKEKASVLYDWVAEYLEYDRSLSRCTGYDAVTTQSVVCQGYTALYNRLCSLCGINIKSVLGRASTLHVWSVITDETGEHYVDATWGDSGPNSTQSTREWFWVTRQFLENNPRKPRTFN